MSEAIRESVARADALQDAGRTAEALAETERALAIEPANPGLRLNAGVLRLALGDFARGWEDYEARWAAIRNPRHRLPDGPRWDGGRVEGTLLAWNEQGLGDQVLYLGLASELAARAAKVTLAVEARLVALAQRSFPDMRVVDLEAATAERYDAQVPLGSAGRFLRTGWDTFLARRTSFLRPDAGRVAALRAALHAERRLLCGVSWRSDAPRFGAAKTVPLALLAPILQLPGLTPVNLQYGDTAEEHAALARSHGVRLVSASGVNRIGDVDGLAALVAACDIVVSISGAAAHLAGALGRPGCVLLPLGRARNWYWHSGAGRNPWYPTLRMFTQAVAGDWAAPLAGVRALVEARLAADRLSRRARPSP